jgi:hypothetical protein
MKHLYNGPHGLHFLRATRALAPFLRELQPDPLADARAAAWDAARAAAEHNPVYASNPAVALAEFYRAQFGGYIPHAHDYLRKRAAVMHQLGYAVRGKLYTAAAWELCDMLKRESAWHTNTDYEPHMITLPANRVFYRITMEDGQVWFASSMLLSTPEKTLATVQRQAVRRGVKATYDLATREQYQAYQKSI